MQPDELLRPFEQKVIRDAEAFANAWNIINLAGVGANQSETLKQTRERLLKSVMVLEVAKELAEDLAKAKPASDGGRMNEAAIGKQGKKP